MSDIYRLMRTNKRFPQKNDLADLLEETGWEVTQSCSAPQLCFTAGEMQDRYRFSDGDLVAINKAIDNSKGCCAAINSADGFTGFLEYRVFVCKAK